MDNIDFLLHFSSYFLFNFFLYGFIGWLIENAYSYFKRRHFQREGFLNGPFKPMYAIAMSLLVVFSNMINYNAYILIPICIIVPTMVEYITGVVMRNYFNKDYWNYSELKYNFQGIICLRFSLYWTVLTFVGVQYFQTYVINNLYSIVFLLWVMICPILLLVLVIDETLSISGFTDNRKVA